MHIRFKRNEEAKKSVMKMGSRRYPHSMNSCSLDQLASQQGQQRTVAAATAATCDDKKNAKKKTKRKNWNSNGLLIKCWNNIYGQPAGSGMLRNGAHIVESAANMAKWCLRHWNTQYEIGKCVWTLKMRENVIHCIASSIRCDFYNKYLSALAINKRLNHLATNRLYFTENIGFVSATRAYHRMGEWQTITTTTVRKKTLSFFSRMRVQL